jgi:hypothetical protein
VVKKLTEVLETLVYRSAPIPALTHGYVAPEVKSVVLAMIKFKRYVVVPPLGGVTSLTYQPDIVPATVEDLDNPTEEFPDLVPIAVVPVPSEYPCGLVPPSVSAHLKTISPPRKFNRLILPDVGALALHVCGGTYPPPL